MLGKTTLVFACSNHQPPVTPVLGAAGAFHSLVSVAAALLIQPSVADAPQLSWLPAKLSADGIIVVPSS